MPNKIIELSPENKNVIEDFEKHLKSAGTNNIDTLRTYTSACKTIFDIVKKDWNNITKKDIDNAFSSDRMSPTTKEVYKPKFVKFLKFNGKDELADYVKSLYNFDVLKKPTKTEDDVLSKEEIKLLIDSAKSLRDKAIIEIFLTTGGRRKEINLLKFKDIEITESIIWVTINNSKTKPRRIPIVANKQIDTAIYPENLINFYNTHIFKDDKEKPLFYSHHSNRYGKPLNKNSINEIFQKIIGGAKISKKITPHILRHTGATNDGYFLTEQDLCLKYGWRVGSRQPKTYCHMTENQLGDHLLKLAGTTEEQIKRDSICPQCKQKVNINDKRCKRCNYILDRVLQNEEIERLRNKENELNELKIAIFNIQNDNNKKLKDFKKVIRDLKKENNGISDTIVNLAELVIQQHDMYYEMSDYYTEVFAKAMDDGVDFSNMNGKDKNNWFINRIKNYDAMGAHKRIKESKKKLKKKMGDKYKDNYPERIKRIRDQAIAISKSNKKK